MSYSDPEPIQMVEQAARAGELRREKDRHYKPMSPKKFFAIFIPVFAALIVFWILMLTNVIRF